MSKNFNRLVTLKMNNYRQTNRLTMTGYVYTNVQYAYRKMRKAGMNTYEARSLATSIAWSAGLYGLTFHGYGNDYSTQFEPELTRIPNETA
jgi:hypothetical protein